jgi:hypothetical protein
MENGQTEYKQEIGKIEKIVSLVNANTEKLTNPSYSAVASQSISNTNWIPSTNRYAKYNTEDITDQDEFPTKTPDLQIDILNSAAAETDERRKRKDNLIIFGLQSHNEDQTESIVKDLFKHLGVDSHVITSITNFNNKGNNNDDSVTKSTPVMVKVRRGHRNQVLYKAKKLAAVSKWTGVSIRPDMTFAERDHHKKLLKYQKSGNEELKKTSSNSRLIIRNGQIKKIDIDIDNRNKQKRNNNYYNERKSFQTNPDNNVPYKNYNDLNYNNIPNNQNYNNYNNNLNNNNYNHVSFQRLHQDPNIYCYNQSQPVNQTYLANNYMQQALNDTDLRWSMSRN